MFENIYMRELIRLLDDLLDCQRDRIDAAAEIIANAISSGGVIHIFGTGHSSLIAQEPFMRAGGLLPINAMLDERVLMSAGSLSSSAAEKQRAWPVRSCRPTRFAPKTPESSSRTPAETPPRLRWHSR